ncbi:hypothetical protein AVEN_95301-1 [Araneus ventricosus]|uniref:Uncharacterized protein n=1 Tax=Araneus ventricosus TaxID=182803 RepID=A0A4Y2KMN4_ARAVE|nr:hypothetical protein AVEN_95301-1 [Araneus ventricosus]
MCNPTVTPLTPWCGFRSDASVSVSSQMKLTESTVIQKQKARSRRNHLLARDAGYGMLQVRNTICCCQRAERVPNVIHRLWNHKAGSNQ